jgi:hypothetical protein
MSVVRFPTNTSGRRRGGMHLCEIRFVENHPSMVGFWESGDRLAVSTRRQNSG